MFNTLFSVLNNYKERAQAIRKINNLKREYDRFDKKRSKAIRHAKRALEWYDEGEVAENVIEEFVVEIAEAVCHYESKTLSLQFEMEDLADQYDIPHYW